jgi:hypothetical protein
MLDAQLDEKVCSEEAEAAIEKKDCSSRKADRTKKRETVSLASSPRLHWTCSGSGGLVDYAVRAKAGKDVGQRKVTFGDKVPEKRLGQGHSKTREPMFL